MQVPKLSLDLIKLLNGIYPPLKVRSKDTYEEIRWKAAQREVVERLLELTEEDNPHNVQFKTKPAETKD